MTMKKRVHVHISGRVQAVAYRANTQKMASRYRLGGWVKNLSDGRVEAVFEGDEADVDAMVAWCRRGPPLAVVDQVDTITEPYEGHYGAFGIEY
jgi:acylphosphatase